MFINLARRFVNRPRLRDSPFPRLNYDSDESEKEPGVIYNGNNRSTVGLKNKLRA